MAKIVKRFNRTSSSHHAVPPDDGWEFLDAASAGDIATVEMMVGKYGPEILEVRGRDWMKPDSWHKDEECQTALMKAVLWNQHAMVEFLIRQGADVDAKDQGGCTPLMLSPNNKMSELLLDNGAKLEAKDNRGRTTLLWPREAVTMIFLLARGADVHARDNEGKTALMRLAGEHDGRDRNLPTERLGLLLDAGAEIDATDKKGQTALMAAAASCTHATNALEKMQYLLQRGAAPLIRDHDGNTAVMLARRTNPDLKAKTGQQAAVVALLVQAALEHEAKTHKAFTEGSDQGVGVMKPLQLKSNPS